MFEHTGSKANQAGVASSGRSRRIQIATHDGKKIGVCIFLSTSELRKLGIDPENNRLIEYQISEFDTQCALLISPANSESTEASTSTTTD